MLEFSLNFAQENKLSLEEVSKWNNEYGFSLSNTRLYDESYLTQNRFTLITTETEKIKANIVDKVQAVHDYSEGRHARINSTVCPSEDDIGVHVPYIDITSLWSISSIRANSHSPNVYLSQPLEYFPTELINLTINAIQYNATTPQEQALGSFAGRNMKILSTWYDWE